MVDKVGGLDDTVVGEEGDEVGGGVESIAKSDKEGKGEDDGEGRDVEDGRGWG